MVLPLWARIVEQRAVETANRFGFWKVVFCLCVVVFVMLELAIPFVDR